MLHNLILSELFIIIQLVTATAETDLFANIFNIPKAARVKKTSPSRR
jgi:hypothetical protein